MFDNNQGSHYLGQRERFRKKIYNLAGILSQYIEAEVSNNHICKIMSF